MASTDRHEQERFWQGVHDDYARLKRDPAAWQDYQNEVAVLESGSMDGLEHEEPYYTPEEEEEIRADLARAQGGL